MKKLITLLLVLTGMVSIASADVPNDYKVYFKPGGGWPSDGAHFALYMERENDGGSHWETFTAVANYDGYYEATYYTWYNKKMIIVRYDATKGDPSWSNFWNQSADLPAPSGNILYELSTFNNTGYSYAVGGTWVMAGNRHIAANYKSWKGTSSENSGNTMTGSGFSYTKTVSDRILKAGTYGFKFVNGDTWVGDPNNNGANFTLTVANDGVYDITYSFNELTHEGSADPVLDGSSVPVDYKYYIFDYNSDGQTYEDITAKGWWENEMTESDGKFYLTLNNVDLTNTTYGFRLVERVYKDGELQSDSNADWAWNYIGTEYGGNNGCRTITIGTAGKYDVTFSYDPVSANYDNTSSTPSIDASRGYYMIRCPYEGSWTVGNRMVRDNNTWTGLVADTHSGYFAIVDATDVDSDPVGDAYSSWTNNKVVRPKQKSSQYAVDFKQYAGETAFKSDDSGYDFVWQPTANNDANITMNYTPSTSSFTIDCARTATIGDAGYITYSNGEKFKVSGADNVYTISANNSSSVRMQGWDASTVFPAGTGVIIKGTTSATIQAVADDESAATLGTNYLVGSGNSPIDEVGTDAGKYIFSWDGSDANTVGFYRSKGGKLAAHKAYLNLGETPAHEFLSFDFGDDTTGISAKLMNNIVTDNTVYNLAGQRVAQPTKGLYIVNGKKVIMK